MAHPSASRRWVPIFSSSSQPANIRPATPPSSCKWTEANDAGPCAFGRHFRQLQSSHHRGQRVITPLRRSRFRFQQPLLHKTDSSMGPRSRERGTNRIRHIAPAKTAASTGTKCVFQTAKVFLPHGEEFGNIYLFLSFISLHPNPHKLDRSLSRSFICPNERQLGKVLSRKGSRLDLQVIQSLECFLFL